ncbi:hypothetical protein Leucomu_01625 [Leucobacter muris]|uniref:DUF1109 domain-containing protein n=1 Tax=Leucobacter muris TaxID=1935379 RepID=A0ABX5QCL1_9MICO|nr:hypothetical protein [Leucobacter muris]QAB16802.1 hypothetical protein Leucomu_01625 [Leucobacter muris]
MTREDRDAVLSTAEARTGEARAVKRRPRLLWGAAIVGFWLLLLLGAVLVGAALWVTGTFGPISVDQLLIPSGAVLVLALLAEKSRRDLRRSGVLRGRRGWVLRGIAAVLVVAVPVGGAVAFGSTVGLGAYVQSYAREASGEATLAGYYVVPRHGLSASAAGGPGMRADGGGSTDPRNLIVIYLESVENSMADDETFDKNMLEPVQQAASGWDSIPSLDQYEGVAGPWRAS